jgi:hypothetical protein
VTYDPHPPLSLAREREDESSLSQTGRGSKEKAVKKGDALALSSGGRGREAVEREDALAFSLEREREKELAFPL